MSAGPWLLPFTGLFESVLFYEVHATPKWKKLQVESFG
jgi:hypothetical protein